MKFSHQTSPMGARASRPHPSLKDPKSPTSRPHPRGMALVLVLILIALIGTALAMSATLFAHDARRTQESLPQAQIRQLLLAAHLDAQSHPTLAASAAPLKLPDSLAAYTLTWQRDLNTNTLLIRLTHENKTTTHTLPLLSS